jgi:hypothetical protein
MSTSLSQNGCSPKRDWGAIEPKAKRAPKGGGPFWGGRGILFRASRAKPVSALCLPFGASRPTLGLLGSGLARISSATPAPWDGPRGAATTTGWLPFLGAATKRTAQAAASRRVARPAGHLLCRRSSACPPRTPASHLRESAPAGRATRKEPSRGQTPCQPWRETNLGWPRASASLPTHPFFEGALYETGFAYLPAPRSLARAGGGGGPRRANRAFRLALPAEREREAPPS